MTVKDALALLCTAVADVRGIPGGLPLNCVVGVRAEGAAVHVDYIDGADRQNKDATVHTAMAIAK